jgi:hypothetical protein
MTNKTAKFFQLDGKTAKMEHLMMLQPHALLMFSWVNLWCLSHGITATWTSLVRTPEENRAVGAKSTTHVEGRGLDLSYRPVWGWTGELRRKFEMAFTLEFADVGALVKVDGKLISRPIVGPNEGHDHFHLQTRPWGL